MLQPAHVHTFASAQFSFMLHKAGDSFIVQLHIHSAVKFVK